MRCHLCKLSCHEGGLAGSAQIQGCPTAWVGQDNVSFMPLWQRAQRRGLVLAVTFLTPKHPVQSARNFIDFIRCRSITTGPCLQLNQPSRPCSYDLEPHLGVPQLIPLGHKAHKEHSSLPGNIQGLKPLIDKELAE